MAPAAKPRPTGRNGPNVSTKTNAGTAISGCGRLEKTLQPPLSDGRPAWHEHEADREPLRDVVHRDRDRDEDAERLVAAERDADADTLRERMHRHHADDQQRAAGVGALERPEMELAVAAERSGSSAR